jgi:hypothetical protein
MVEDLLEFRCRILAAVRGGTGWQRRPPFFFS